MDHHPARRRRDHAGGLRKRNPAFAIVEHRVIALRVMSAIDGAEKSLRAAAGSEASDPALRVEIERGTLSPPGAFLLADPGTGEAEDIDEGKFGGPIGRPGEVHAHARLCRRRLHARRHEEEQLRHGRKHRVSDEGSVCFHLRLAVWLPAPGPMQFIEGRGSDID